MSVNTVWGNSLPRAVAPRGQESVARTKFVREAALLSLGQGGEGRTCYIAGQLSYFTAESETKPRDRSKKQLSYL